MRYRCGVCKIVGLLSAIGAINWGLVGLFQYDLVGHLLGFMTLASRVVYTIVGVSGIMLLVYYVKPCPICQKTAQTNPMGATASSSVETRRV